MIKKITVMTFILLFLAGISFSQEKKEEVIKLDAKSCYQKCVEFIKAKDATNAIKYGEKAVELDSKNSDYQYQLGAAYGIKLNHKDTAMMEKMTFATNMLNAWKKAVELDETNVKARQGLIGFYLNAPAIAGGSVKKAEEQAEELIKYDKLLGYTAYAGIFIKNKEFGKARDFALKGFKLHMELKQNNPTKKSSFNVFLLNNLGYGLFNSGKKKEAIEVFKMNIKAYPKNFNVYDSLGETYMNTGETKLAIKNYEKALALNPNKTEFEKRIYNNQKKCLIKLKAEKK